MAAYYNNRWSYEYDSFRPTVQFDGHARRSSAERIQRSASRILTLIFITLWIIGGVLMQNDFAMPSGEMFLLKTIITIVVTLFASAVVIATYGLFCGIPHFINWLSGN